MRAPLPTRQEAKSQAKQLRQVLKRQGTEITHAQALEQVAQLHGCRDWNTFCAQAEKAPAPPWQAGQIVTGAYLSIPIRATVLSARTISPGWTRLVLDLDEPVDVVKFDSFSSWRKRLHVNVGPDRHSKEKTSDGVPHIRLD